jgi:hypothetical protein
MIDGYSRVLCLDPDSAMVRDEKCFVHMDCAEDCAKGLLDSFRFLNIIKGWALEFVKLNIGIENTLWCGIMVLISGETENGRKKEIGYILGITETTEIVELEPNVMIIAHSEKSRMPTTDDFSKWTFKKQLTLLSKTIYLYP